MKRRAALLTAISLLLASAPAAGQFQPGLRPPQTLRDGINQSFWEGCHFAVSGRGANGLNMPLDTNGATLRAPDAVPEGLRAFSDTLDDAVRPVVLDTPEGAVWTFFHPTTLRCLIVPEPAGAEGVEAELLRVAESNNGWRPVERQGGGRAFEEDFDGPRLLNQAGRMRTYYQPGDGPARPQMIVVERVR